MKSHKHPKGKTSRTSKKAGGLTQIKYIKFTQDYLEEARKHFDSNLHRVPSVFDLIGQQRRPRKELIQMRIDASITHPGSEFSYPIAKEIVEDFKGTKNLKVFGFGVGYNELGFFLKNHMKASVAGADMGTLPLDFSKGKKLGVKRADITKPTIRKFGKHDVTYSVNVLSPGALGRNETMAMIENAAHMTKVGGRSYHTFISDEGGPHLDDIKKLGFEIEKNEKMPNSNLFFLKFKRVPKK